MKTIWKSEISPNSAAGKPYRIVIKKVPVESRPISVGLQRDKACVWFEVDPEETELADMTLYSVGTGFGAVPVGCRFLGTLIMGEYVWHIYTPIP